MFKLSRQQKDHRYFCGNKYEKYSIKKLKVGAASVLVGTGFLFGYNLDQVKADEQKTEMATVIPKAGDTPQSANKVEVATESKQEKAPEVGTETPKSGTKEETVPATSPQVAETNETSSTKEIPAIKETPATKEVPENKANKVDKEIVNSSTLREKLADLEAQIERIRGNKKQASHIQNAEKLLAEAKKFLESSATSQTEVDAKAKEISSLTNILKSIKAKETPKINKNQDRRNGKMLRNGTGFRIGNEAAGGATTSTTTTGVGADVVDAKEDATVTRPPYTERKIAEGLAKQIAWLDFSDERSWTNVDKENGNIYLKEGSVYEKEIMPNYHIKLTVKSLKPFQATEIYRKRMEAHDATPEEKATFNLNATNGRINSTDSTRVKITAQAQNQWSEIRDNGINTEGRKTSIKAEGYGANIGIQFEISGTYKGNVVRPAVVMIDAESANRGEMLTFTTNGSGWKQIIDLKKNREDARRYQPVNYYTEAYKQFPDSDGGNDVNATAIYNVGNGNKIVPKFFTNPDQATGGLGSGVFGPGLTARGYSTPVVMTKGATEIGMYVFSTGEQAAMMGVLPLDEGDAPATYGEATHAMNTRDGLSGGVVKQPYLGSERPDADTGNPKDWDGDDRTDAADEGIKQLLPESLKESEGNIIKANISNAGYYTLNIQAHTGGAEKAYIRSWIDFNNNRQFDSDEASDIAEITQDGDVKLHFKNKTQKDAGELLQAGTRVRIATSKDEIMNPTGLAFSGEVEDFNAKITHPPKGEKKTTIGEMKETQRTTVHFTPKGKNIYAKDDVNAEIDTTVNPVYINNKTGEKITLSDENTYTVKGQGTYKFTPNGKDVDVEFTPEKGFVGKAHGITIRRQDTNKTTTDWGTNDEAVTPNVNDVLNTMDGLYIPEVRIPTVQPTPNNAESRNIQGFAQKGKPTFNVETSDTPVTASVKHPARLINPRTNALADSAIVDALDPNNNKVGTYKIAPETGEVTFTPNIDYKGEVQPVKVSVPVVVAHDKDDKDITVDTVATYTPRITPVTPTAEASTTRDVQGKAQVSRIVFDTVENGADKNQTVNFDKSPEVSTDGEHVELDKETLTLVNASGVETNTVTTDQGEYVLDKVSKTITFTPKKTFVGTATAVNIRIKDMNGTKVETTYTPTVLEVSPTGKDSATSGPQGLTQKSPILFNEREETDGTTLNFDTGHERVALKPETLTLLNGTAKVKSITVENVGTYELVDNAITFTPAPAYHGTAEGVNVQVEDENGTVVTKKYVPTVKELTITPEGKTTRNIQGETQEGTPDFPIPAESKNNVTVTSRKLVDPTDQTQTEKDSVTLAGKGTFTIDGNGKVTFVPVPTYKEDVPPITVKATVTITNAKNESTTITSTASYKPIIVPAEIDKAPATSTNLQGLVQTGTPTFTSKAIEVDGVQKTISVQANSYKLVKDGKESESLPAYKAGTAEQIGTYTINPQNGTVTFTPTDKTYTGAVQPVDVQATGSNGVKVHTTYTPTITPVTPTKEPSATTDVQGKKQVSRIVLDTVETDADKDKTVNFNKGSETGANGERVNLNPDTLTLLNDAGAEVPTLTTSDGEYVLDKANKTITFTPNKTFTGSAKPVKVQIKDVNGTKVETTYTPTVTDVTMTSVDKGSSAPQGKTQTGTPTFTVSTPEVRITGYKLLNPTGNTPVEGNEIEVPNEGTYRINPTTGQVTFIPKPGFTGPATGITVQATDENGETKDAKYKPTVTALTITPQPVTTKNIQGETQEGTPTFTIPAESTNATVTSRKLVDPVDQTEKDSVKVEGKGTFTIDGNGKVTFTPLPTYKGDVDPITVKATVTVTNAKNESATITSTASYKPIIVAAEIDKEPATSTNLQGLTQTGTPTFKSKTVDVDGTPKTISVQPNSYKLVKDGLESESLPAYKAGTTVEIGTYTINSATGQVTFTPSDKTYSGAVEPVSVQATGSNGVKVETTYTPIITPVTPSGTNTTSSGLQGKVQTGKPVFNGGVPEVPMNDEVPATLEGADQDGKVVIAGKGTYTVAKDGTVTFTPDKNFVGEAPAVTVKRVDKNGTIATATYTPTVTDVSMTSENKTSEALQGKTQTGTPTFTISTPDVRITEYKLIDPTNNTPVEEVEVGNQGTYSIDEVTGEVTFVPKPGFTGPTTGITVRATDENGEIKDATYTPSVTPLKVTPENKSTMNIQGLPQEATPTFKLPKGVTNAVVTERKLIDPSTKALTNSVTVDEKGTFTINANGKVTFTPVPSYVGDVPAIEVQGTITILNDNNDRTTITSKASYKPIIVPIELEKTPADSTEVQGLVQKGTPKFTSPESVEINGVEKTVTVKPNSYKLVKDGTETDSIPAYKKDTREVIGKYTIDSQTGEVTFTPTDKTYTGEVEPATVQVTGSNNVKVQTTYTPIIKPVKPVGTNAGSEGIQGAEQEGTPTFTAGKANIGTTENPVEKTVPLTISATNPAKFVVDGQPVEETTIPAKEGDKQVGTYTIEPATGKVTFTPNKDYHGIPTPVTVQAKDDNGTPATATYSPVVKPAVPTADKQKTTDVQGAKQTATPVFTPGKNTVNNKEVEVPFESTSKAKLVDPSKTGEAAEVTTLEVPKQGTYTIDDNGVVTFTPLPTFTGEATPVSIVRKDKNGTPATATYTPKVVGVTPTSENANSEGIQGATQEGTPTFTAGKANIGTEENPVEKTVPITISATNPAKFVVDGQPVADTTIPAKDDQGQQVGTYTIEPATGKVTFAPNPGFSGTPVPATVQAKDGNGTPTTATYTPVVKAAVPSGDNQVRSDIQGAKQTVTPVFTPGKNTVNNQEVSVPFEATSKAKLIDPSKTGDAREVTTLVVENQGTYTIDDNGVVTFTPLPTFKGEATPVSIVRKDKNGTPATATFKPSVVGVTPSATEATTTKVQGATQETPVTFTPGKATIGTTEKSVPMDPASYKLLGGQEGKTPLDKVPAMSEDGTKQVGTYTIKVVDGKPVVTFTPTDKTYAGKLKPVTVQGKDTNGTEATTTYTSVITPIVPTAENGTSEGPQGVEQTGSVTFNPGKEPGTENTPVAIDKTKMTLLGTDGNPVESLTVSKDGKEIGTYTLVKDPSGLPTGEVKFTPTDKSYVGEVPPATVQVKDANGTPATATYTPTFTEVNPTSKPSETTGFQGLPQTSRVVLDEKDEADNTTVNFDKGNDKVALVPNTLTLVNADGAKVTSVTVPNEGTYELNNGVITFTPLPTFHGKASGVSVQAEDVNGKVAKTTYTPTVTEVRPVGTDAGSEGIQGAPQSGTPSFKSGNENIPMTVSATNPAKLVDPANNQPIEATEIDAKNAAGEKVGLYTINPATGEVTFTPEPGFSGTPVPATVQAKDGNGTPTTATYTPVVKAAVPSGDNQVTSDIQGAKQTATPVFTPGKNTVNNQEVSVPFEATSKAKLIDPSKTGDEREVTTLVVENQGTYTIDDNGVVTFTPLPTFKGEATAVSIVRKDKNGTPATATFKPNVVGVTPSATEATTTKVQGATQETPVTFTPGKATIGTTEKSVPMDPASYKLLGGQEGKTPLDKVPAMSEDGTKEVGTYTIKVVEGKPVVTFTPTDKTYAGKLKPVSVQGKDTNGTEATTTYTPVITPIVPTSENGTSEGPQGVEQTGRVTFNPGKEPGTENTPVAIDKTKITLLGTDGNPVESLTVSKDGKEIGTYTLVKDPSGLPTGEVKFTPTDKSYVGEVPAATVQVKDANGTPATATYTPTFTEVNPTGKDSATTGLQGFAQKSPIVFNQKDEEDKTTVNFDSGHEKVTFKQDTLTLVNAAGDKVTTVTVPDVGTYELKDGVITFTPLKTFKGKTTGVTVQVEDANGKIVKKTYVPNVVEVLPTGKDTTSTGLQGKVQTGTPVFTPGNPEVPMDDESPATFEDGNITKTVDKVGTYTVAKDGTVTFTPDKEFVGEAPEVTVKRVDKNGTAVTAKYKPIVAKVLPTGESSETEGAKGKPQTSAVIFDKKDEDKSTVNFNKGDETVALNPSTLTLVDKNGNPSTEVKVPGEGTYTLANNVITFTPEKDFAGKATGVTVQVKDINGTSIEKTYTPTVRAVTTFVDPSGNPITVDKNNKPVESEVDGSKQSTKEIYGYKFVRTETDNKGNTKHIYEQAEGQSVKVTYVSTTGETLSDSQTVETKDKFIGTDYDASIEALKLERIEKDGKVYLLKERKTDSAAENGKLSDKEQTVTYVYEEVKELASNQKYGNVVVVYRDKFGRPISGTTESGKEVASTEIDTPSSPINTEYDTTDHKPQTITTKDGKKYKLIKVLKTSDAEKSGVKARTSVITYVYEMLDNTTEYPEAHIGLVLVNYLDEEGNPISGKTPEGKVVPNMVVDTEADLVGKDYDTTDHKVSTIIVENGDVYELIKVSESSVEKGKLTEGATNVNYIYHKVVTKFVDENGKEIKSPEKGRTDKKDIPEYTFKETKKDVNGNTVHVYTKKSSSTPVTPTPTPSTPSTEKETLYVDANGKPLQPAKKGQHPQDNIPGYEFVRTETDANGNVRHLYRKIQSTIPVEPVQPTAPTMPEQPAQPEVPTSPAQPVQPTEVKEVEAKRELPNTGTEDHASLAALGLLGALSGFGLLASKKKED